MADKLLVIVTTNFAINTTHILIKTSVWTDLEGNLGLWVACFPTLQPLLRIATRALGLSSSNKTTGHLGYRNQASETRTHQTWVHHGTKRDASLSDASSAKGIVDYERESDLEMNYLGNAAKSRDIVRTIDIEVRRS
jgi:hypothetical protein